MNIIYLVHYVGDIPKLYFLIYYQSLNFNLLEYRYSIDLHDEVHSENKNIHFHY